MIIHAYEFGGITIDNKHYHSDVIITPEHVYADWWRKQGHNLDKEDLQKVIDARPEALIIGTGYYGNMQIPQDTLAYLRSMGIKVEFAKTSDAVEKFNQLQRDCANIAAALHLTC